MAELMRVARAIATNQVARWSPAAYLRLTGQTGRGDGQSESAAHIAEYFLACVDDYLDFAQVPAAQRSDHFHGLAVVEYGPGDFPGVALLLIARGARKVWCIDRFPMVSLSEKNLAVLRTMLERLDDAQRARLLAALVDPAQPARGFRADRLEYVVRPHGFCGLREVADLVISRAVLEHVDDLPGTFADMLAALRPGGRALHQVDLKSHGLHRDNPLDFLAWPTWLWHAMYSQKGVPNRWRIDRYRDIVAALPVEEVTLQPTLHASDADVRAVRERLARPFRHLGDEDLACLGFWLGFRKPELPR